MRDWSGQRVVIVGAARQGLALARYLAGHGAQVVLTDRRPLEELKAEREGLADLERAGARIEWVAGGHPLSLLEGADLLCPSGGVPLDLPLIAQAQRRGIPLSNDSQIFLEESPCRVVGITGSAGKTTTTTLVGRFASESLMLETPGPAFHQVFVGGNIGSPLISELDQMQPDDLAVMELSSFQLEIMTRSPQVAAVLNITPNHLDRHRNMQAYTAAKANILNFQNGQGAAVLGRDDPGAWSLRHQVHGRLLSFGFSPLPEGQEGAFLSRGMLMLRSGGSETPVMPESQVALRGRHNLLNVLAACAIAEAARLPSQAIPAGVKDFRGVPHRLEFIRSWGGADWYNDSIATAPERVMAAIRSFEEPLVLLVGGRDKKLPWEPLAELASRRVEHLVVFGEAADKILQAFHSIQTGPNPLPVTRTITRCATLQEAVQAAAHIVQPGEIVLLSPGGTSFDEFRDFEERGKCFTRLVKALP